MVKKTTYQISRMDCPSEEQLIRLKLADVSAIQKLEFDLLERKLIVYHYEESDLIFQKLDSLGFGTSLLKTEFAEDEMGSSRHDESEEKSLHLKILLVNLSLFFLELAYGYFSNSMGLVADSLDMLADSLVYSMALFAVGGSVLRKRHVSKAAGYFQIVLAALGMAEVIKRYAIDEVIPDFQTMILISLIALIGNAYCLFALRRSKSDEAHMRASLIFTSNDVIVNLGVICAGLLVFATNSKLPDLIIGSVVFMIVGNGAIKILKLH